jgi:predicted TIM-barrel fold metal-dependent hydrolase
MTKLTETIDNLYTPVHDGTVAGLLKNMDEWGIDVSVIHPVITKASQVRKTNEWIKSVCSGRIVGFGGIYPHSDSFKEDIDYVAELGLKGLKFHAEYQNFIVDDVKMLKIYDYALSKGLILLHHAGYDPAYPPPFKSTPQQFAKIGRELRGGVIIAAHLGGHAQWSDVEEHLAGSSIYLDTSMGFEYFSQEQFLRIVKKHTPGKILFGSDSPWSNAKTEIEHIKRLPLAENDISAILGGNAKKVLQV